MCANTTATDTDCEKVTCTLCMWQSASHDELKPEQYHHQTFLCRFYCNHPAQNHN